MGSGLLGGVPRRAPEARDDVAIERVRLGRRSEVLVAEGGQQRQEIAQRREARKVLREGHPEARLGDGAARAMQRSVRKENLRAVRGRPRPGPRPSGQDGLAPSHPPSPRLSHLGIPRPLVVHRPGRPGLRALRGRRGHRAPGSGPRRWLMGRAPRSRGPATARHTGSRSLAKSGIGEPSAPAPDRGTEKTSQERPAGTGPSDAAVGRSHRQRSSESAREPAQLPRGEAVAPPAHLRTAPRPGLAAARRVTSEISAGRPAASAGGRSRSGVSGARCQRAPFSGRRGAGPRQEPQSSVRWNAAEMQGAQSNDGVPSFKLVLVGDGGTGEGSMRAFPRGRVSKFQCPASHACPGLRARPSLLLPEPAWPGGRPQGSPGPSEGILVILLRPRR